MIKKIFVVLSLLFLVFLPKGVLAVEGDTFVTVTNPVRGEEGWKLKDQKPLDIPMALYEESSRSGLPSNWLLRYDAVESATISGFFKDLIGPDKLVSLGGLLEITPGLAQKANINYQGNGTTGLYLSGYTLDQRFLLIDAFMSTFKSRFGFFPRFVGAWHLDSNSLGYLQKKYSVLTAMIADEQYSTDNLRLWGGYLGSPYFPDKNNSLLPAQTAKDRLDLTIVRWSQKDLFNVANISAPGRYSVEPNDYLSLGLGTSYFNSLLNQYSQKDFNQFTYLNTGLENDQAAQSTLPEIPNIYQTLLEAKEKNKIRFVSLEYFGNWLLSLYPENSPVYFYRTGDPVNNAGQVFWYQSPYYRIGLKHQNEDTKIVDFRVYNRNIYDDYATTANQTNRVNVEIPAVIDAEKNPLSAASLGLNLSEFKTVYDPKNDYYKLTLQNENQKITFTENSVIFTDITAPSIATSDIKITQKGQQTVWQMSPKPLQNNIFSHPWLIFLIILLVIIICFRVDIIFGLGTLISLFPLCVLVKDSHFFSFGLGYWGSNAHDAIFHLSIIEKITKSPLNLSHPQIAGEKLSNYHFVYDYLVGLLGKVTTLSSSEIFFFFLPVLMAVVLTALIVKLLRLWRFSNKEILMSLFFVYLGGSLGFLPSLISGHGPFSGESVFWANQSISLFLNPPFALSLIILVSTVLLLEKLVKTKTRKILIPLVLLGGLLSQTKVYAFFLLLGGLFLSGQWLVTLLVGLVGLAFTLPFSSMQGFPFVFDPFWFIRSMFAASDRLNLERVAGAWQSYEATGSFLKLIILNLLGLVIFFIGNLGTRILGVWEAAKQKKPLLSQKVLLLVAVLGLLIPLVFTQKFNPWNSIQFMYYSLFILGLYSGKGMFQLTQKIKSKFWRNVLFIFLLLCTLLTSIGTLKDHLGFWPASRISYTEVRALLFLRTQPTGLVLSPFYDNLLSGGIYDPKPLYAYTSTAYISALSGQPEYLSDTINLDITGFNYQGRAKDIQRFYNTNDVNWAKGFLKKNNIKYIYETPLKRLKLSPASLSLTQIFESGEINIYQTN